MQQKIRIYYTLQQKSPKKSERCCHWYISHVANAPAKKARAHNWYFFCRLHALGSCFLPLQLSKVWILLDTNFYYALRTMCLKISSNIVRLWQSSSSIFFARHLAEKTESDHKIRGSNDDGLISFGQKHVFGAPSFDLVFGVCLVLLFLLVARFCSLTPFFGFYILHSRHS